MLGTNANTTLMKNLNKGDNIMYFKKCCFYIFGATNKRGLRVLLNYIPLELPFILIILLHLVTRFSLVQNIPIKFILVALIASLWFIIGPRLVYKFIDEFISIENNMDLNKNIREYFKNNQLGLYKNYIKYMVIESSFFICVGIIPICIYPDILIDNNITLGKNDWIFWLIILFLSWMLIYCANATSFISLLTFDVIKQIKSEIIFVYNPLSISDQKSIHYFIKLCNQAINYTCSGLLFIPLAVYYFKTSQNPITILWVSLLMFFYSFFLIGFVMYHNISIRGYVKRKNKECILKEETNFFWYYISLKNNNRKRALKNDDIFSAYLHLQEIKSLCQEKYYFDTNAIATIIAGIITLISSVPGFITVLQ